MNDKWQSGHFNFLPMKSLVVSCRVPHSGHMEVKSYGPLSDCGGSDAMSSVGIVGAAFVSLSQESFRGSSLPSNGSVSLSGKLLGSPDRPNSMAAAELESMANSSRQSGQVVRAPTS